MKSFLQFIKFCIVGVFNTVVSYSVYVITVFALSNTTSMNEDHPIVYLTANVLSFIISVFTAFLISNKFVFKESEEGEKRIWWKTLIKTYMSYGVTGLIVGPLLLVVWIDIINISNYLTGFNEVLTKLIGLNITNEALATYIGPLFNMVFTIPINFFMNKYWAYRQKSVEIV